MKWYAFAVAALFLAFSTASPAQNACSSIVCVGAAKSVTKNGRELTYSIVVENLGSGTLEDISVAEDLDGVFGAGNYTLLSGPSRVSGPVSLQVNAGFDGSTDTELVDAASTLVSGASATIAFTVEITTPSDQGSGQGVYTNQVAVTGIVAGEGGTSDLSDNGVDPDPNGNGDAGDADEDDPTVVSLFSSPRLGVSKAASVSGNTIDMQITVVALGNENLQNLSLIDDLDAAFGAGNYTVSAAPSFVDDPGSVVLNAGYNGSSDADLISSGSLILGAELTLVFSVDITNPADVGFGVGNYRNQAQAFAETSLGQTTSDLSTEGFEPDPNGNGIATEGGENVPTTIVLGEEPSIGVAKDVSVSGDLATVDLYFENLGNVTLSSLSALDDLNDVFGAGSFFLSSAPTLIDDPGTVTLNPAFDGNFDIELFDAANSTLASGDTLQLRFVVDVLELEDRGAGLGNYSNQVFVEGVAPGGGFAFDASDDGTDPDPNGNGDASDAGEDDATAFSIAPRSSLGVAKRAINVGLSGGSPLVELEFTLTNYGNRELNSITVSDDLNAVYGAGNYLHIQDPVYVGGSPTLNYNAAFNGNTNTSLLNAGSSLAPGDSSIFRIQSRITNVTDQGFGAGIYQNQATANALDPSASPVSDLSHEGADPDANGDGDPSNDSDPTVIDVTGTQEIGIATDVSVTGNQATFDVYLENLGTVDLDSLSVRAEFDSVFGAGNYFLSAAPSFIDDPGTINLDAAYSGAADAADLALPLSSSLAAGDTAQIRFQFDVTRVTNEQGLGIGSYSTQPNVVARTPDGVFIDDDSDSGSDPDPNGNGEADEAGENDPTTFSFGVDSPVGVAKDAAISDNVVTIDLYLENLGAGTLDSVSLVDDLDGAFGAGNYSVTTPPSFIVDPGTLTLNGAFNGGSDTELLDASSTLSGGATAQIQFEITIDEESDQGAGFGVYSNQAQAAGTQANGVTIIDASDDGADPDPNGNSDPGDAGEDDPTAIVITRTPAVGIAKKVYVDGTTVTFDFYIENLGNSTLTNFFMEDPLNPVFGSGNFSIQTQPFLVDGPGTLLRSPQFFGFNIFARVITGGSLRPGEVSHIRTVISVNNVTDQGNGLGVFINGVTVTATDPAGNMFMDDSDDGIDPDPNGNGDAGDAGEDDDTQFTIGDEARIGLAKDVSVSGNQVTIDFYLENLGGSTLNSLSLTDNLDDVFGAGNYSINGMPSFIDDPGNINLNAGYDGAGTTELIDAGSTLAGMDTAQIRLLVDVTTVTDQGAGLGAYSNQAFASGTAPLGSTTSDTSDAGTDPDPNGNGLANDAGEADPSTFTVGFTRVGVAKNATVNGSQVTFDYYVENLGSTNFTNVSLTDDFDAVFGAGNYTLVGPPDIVSAPRQFVVNSNFDGSTDTQLIASGGLNLGVTEQIQVVVEINELADMGSGLGVYTNQVTVNADASSDVSDAGTDPDPSGDDDANGPNENDPTVFTVAQNPQLGAAKQVSVSDRNLTVDVFIEHFGNVEASNVSVIEDLDTLLNAGNYTVTQSPVLISGPASITVNGGFDGSGQNDLLAPGSSMAIGETARITFSVRVDNVTDAGFGAGNYFNQVTVSAQAPDSTVAMDDSDNGTDPDPNGNGIPDEAGENDASPIVLESVVQGQVYNDLNGDGLLSGEPGIDGITVFLDLNSNGVLDGGEPSDVTSGGGVFFFNRLTGSAYTIQIVESDLPASFVLTGGSNPTSVTVNFPGEVVTDVTGYQQQDASIGDTVYNDLDGDAAQNAGEPGLAGVTVFLDSNTNGVLDGGEPSAVTDASGNYAINDLAPGSYAVGVDASSVPAGFVLTTANDPTVVTLATGEVITNVDFGYQQRNASIGDLVWQDDNGNGVLDGAEAPLAGAIVYIDENSNAVFDAGEPSGATDFAGIYSITGLATGTYDVAVDTNSIPANLALVSGSFPTTVSLAAGEVFLDADFGFEVEPEPGFAKSFASSTVIVGDPVRLAFDIDNSANLVVADNLDFTDNFPAGMTVAPTPNASTTCTGGTLTAVAGAGSVSYTAGQAPASTICVVSVDVVVNADSVFANTSGDLTSSLGNSGPASASLTGIIPPPPAFSKAFASASVTTNVPVALTFTVNNGGATVLADNLTFTDPFPAGMTVANPANASTTCTGGTLTAAPASNAVSYSGGSVPAGSVCTVSVDIVVSDGQTYTNTTSDLTSTLGNSGPASDSVTGVVPPEPLFSKQFATGAVTVDTPVTLTFSIDNTAAPVPADDLAFTDPLPAGMTVASPANASSTCAGGNLTASPGDGSIVYSAGSVPAGAACEITVDVVASSEGLYTNLTGDLTSTLGNSGAATDTLDVRAISVTLDKTFLDDNVLPGSTIGLRYTITNTSALFAATSIGFSDNLGAGLPGLERISTDLVDNCGPGAVGGVDPVVVSNVSLAPGDVCTIEVTLQLPAFVAGGTYTIDSTPVIATLDGVSVTGNSASGSFTVNGSAVAIPTLNRWMLLLLVLIMSGVAMVRMRR